MNQDHWDRLRALFSAAREMSDAERRERLDRELADEPEVRRELQALLAADAEASGFLEAPRPPGPGTARAVAVSPEERTIGPYRILDLLGEGGFGIVYLAEQVHPIRRRVALKLVKPGMDTRQVLARFEVERQALALMDHPGIARVFDAGATEAGHPYFAMEYVPGVSITEFCDAERLRVRERCELFLRVCDAVQHAHQKGVIHRDLKPSNVIVARRDGEVILKVIDFGVGKATAAGTAGVRADLEARSFLTREGMIIGTLGYMSPEQAGATSAEVDTRSDIYSLGVLLFELLSGDLPFPSARLLRAAWDEALRVIREEDPPTLTARVAQAQPSAEQAAFRRSVDERTLRRELKGDLEWITLRALEKNPDRRYASASEMSADVRRHLTNEPVLAGQPSAIYRVRKYARRHRAGVTAALLVFASLVAGAVTAGIGFRRAVRAEQEARREADSARRVADFLVELFDSPSPDRSMGETITARTLLDLGARRIEGESISDPAVRARLLSTLAAAHSALGLFEEAINLQVSAVEATGIASGPDSPEFGREVARLAETRRQAGDTEGVDSLIGRAIAILSRAEATDPTGLALALQARAGWLRQQGEYAAADSVIRGAIALAERPARPDTATLATLYNSRAGIAAFLGAYRDEEKDYLHALALARARHGERHTTVFVIHRNLARLYAQLGDGAEARRHAEEALILARVMFSPGHPYIAAALTARGDVLMQGRQYDEAAAGYEEALGILRAAYQHDHPKVADALFTLASIHQLSGRLDLAIERMREAAAMRERLYGPDSPRTAETRANLARLYYYAGRDECADSLYRKVLPLLEPAIRTRPHAVAYACMGLANVCRDRGRMGEAEALYARAEALMDTSEVPLRAYYGECLADHGWLRALQGRSAEAESLLRAGLERQGCEVNPDSADLAPSYLLWAAARARSGDTEGARQMLAAARRCGITDAEVARRPQVAALR